MMCFNILGMHRLGAVNGTVQQGGTTLFRCRNVHQTEVSSDGRCFEIVLGLIDIQVFLFCELFPKLQALSLRERGKAAVESTYGFAPAIIW